MKVTAVFTAILSLAVAYTDLRLTDDAAIGNIPRVQFVPIAAGADHSAIPVKVAHSLIRTYGFNKPSDADIDDFAEDNDYSDEDAPYDLRSLYTAPVLIFLEDAGNNAIAYYADRGINTIKAYPENYAILNRLLDTSNAVVLSYRPEKYLYPADRYAVSNRFFTPTNYKNALVLAYARAPENNRVNDAPLVFRKYEIPSSYSPTRTQYAEYDIDRIPYAYKYPATLKPTNVPEYSLLKERIPFSTYATDADYTYSKLLDGYTLKYYCAKYPYACSRLAQPGVSPVTVPIDPAKVATLKSETENIKKPLDAGYALNPCAKNPLACGIPLRTAPYLVKSPTITNRPLAYIPYNSDPLYDAKINNLHHKQIIPNIAYKYNSPVVPSDDYLDDYYPATIPSTDLSQGGVLKTLLRPFNLKDQILTTNVWLEHEWQDHKFRWDPAEYGGVTELYVPSEHIWLPDIVLYNNADGEYMVTTMTKAVLHHTGKVVWTPPAIFKSSCEIDVRYFPFDQQTCFMKFGSWSYDGNQIDLKHINQKYGENKVEVGIDLREYYPSVEWDILGVPAERHEKYYTCCAEPYPDIFFNITLRRKTLFYTVNLIVPCVGISYLSVLVFYLPADSGEKIALCITILLSQTMFFLLISEIIPSTSLALPLLGKYLLFTMILVGLCVVITIMVLNVHYRKPSTHKMASWVKKLFIQQLPKLLLMRVPDQLLADLAANNRLLRDAKRSKLNAALAAATSSAASSPDSLRHFPQRPGGCNGLHSSSGATNRFSGLIGALGGSGGYNGLPSMVGFDESLSDVALRKKYPFELEKAIHNVKFIQHHIQRQDEFNAEDQDWGFVAMVLDRLFLWIFTIASLVGTFAILCEAPALYDDTKPIDTEISLVAQQQFLPDVDF